MKLLRSRLKSKQWTANTLTTMGYRASVVHPEHGSEYVRWTETRVL